MVKEIFVIIFLSAGFLFLAISAIGVLRMKDFYNRIHAAEIGETAGLVFSSLGLFLYEGFTMTGLKILLIFTALLIASPVGTHIIGRVAYKQESVRKEKEGKEDTYAGDYSGRTAIAGSFNDDGCDHL